MQLVEDLQGVGVVTWCQQGGADVEYGTEASRNA
jgi:hypothetical protein